MKRISTMFFALTLVILLVGCRGEKIDESQKVSINYNSMENILSGISEDFAVTGEELTKELEKVHEEIGGTFDGYIENQQSVLDWYDLVKTESEALYERTRKNAVEYYKLVAKTVDKKDDRAIEDAIDAFEDVIYEDAFDDYEDAIYEDAFDDLEDTYYEGIIDDAEDTMEWDDWYDISSEFYDDWYDARSDFYDDWYDARSDIYDDWYEVKWEFEDYNFDVDDILNIKTIDEIDNKKEDEKPAEEAGKIEYDEKAEESKTTEETVEWRVFLEEYEEWVDDYIEILQKYKENPSDLSILSDYADMMVELAEWTEKTETVQEEIENASSAELAEYSAELLRIAAKISQVAY